MRLPILIVSIISCLFGNQSCLAQQKIITGLNFIEESQYRSIPLASTPLFGSVPDRVDLSALFPVPGNQGNQSSCVGWAIAALKSYQEKVERKWSLTSASNKFSPSYIYNQIRSSVNCDGGSNFVDALNLLRKSGAATLEDFPYVEADCSRVPDAAVNQRAREFSIADWRRVNVQDETEIKTQIASGFPVLIGMMVDEGFGRLSKNEIYERASGEERTGHAMVAVGYDDEKGAFKVINSWGTEWGDKGFGWIKYAAFRLYVREAYIAQDIIIYKPKPESKPDPVTDPAPQPDPSPVQDVQVLMGMPTLLHNISVQSPMGLQSGMQVRVPGPVKNAAGRSLQIVVKFNFLNGPPLRANPSEFTYRDTGGLVAAGTQPIPIASNSENMDPIQIFVPYYALNFQPTGGAALHNLSFTVVALVDNQPKAQSQPVPFYLRW